MKHTLRIKVSKQKVNDGVVTWHSVKIREKILRFLLGSPIKLTVIVPGDSVDQLSIEEVPESNDEIE